MKKGVLDFSIGPIYRGMQHPARTGGWRVYRPEIDTEKCNRCFLCWLYCPEGCIKENNGFYEIDYDYCKGCGICAAECKAKAINMVRE